MSKSNIDQGKLVKKGRYFCNNFSDTEHLEMLIVLRTCSFLMSHNSGQTINDIEESFQEMYYDFVG